MNKILNAIYIIIFFVTVSNVHMYLMHLATPEQFRWEYVFLSLPTYFSLYVGSLLAASYLALERNNK